MPDIFNIYKTDFSAIEYQLINNYRSSTALVNIQNIIVNSLIGKAQFDAISMQKEKEVEAPCRVLAYSNELKEAQDITKIIQDLVVNQNILTSEICILTKQQPDIFTKKVQLELKIHDWIDIVEYISKKLFR